MARRITLTDHGELIFNELRTNGLDGVTVTAPASLAASYGIELPDALPGSAQFLTLDNLGKLALSVGSTASLDAGYDSGGAGAGRIITADSGPVEAAGAGGFLASHSAPVYGLETTGAELNYRLTAGQAAGIFEIQVGDADGDISDDTFSVGLALDGTNLRLGVGTAAPGTLAHFLAPAATAAKLTLEAPATLDASVVFTEDSTARWEVGYDDSEGGLVVGRLSFSNPVLMVEDTTGFVKIGDITTARTGIVVIEKPDTTAVTGVLHIADPDGGGPLLFVSKLSTSTSDHSVARFDNARVDTTVPVVTINQAGDGDGLRIDSNAPDGFPALNVDMAGGEAAAWFRRRTLSSGGPVVLIQDDVGATGGGILIDQNGDGEGLSIDSESTQDPLIDLAPINGNSRGDIAFGVARTGDPSAPAEGDFWYNSTTKVLKYYDGTSVKTITAV